MRMRIAAEIRAHRADASRLRAQSAGRREESVTVTVASEAEQAGGSAEGPTVKEVMLLAITEAPGRPLSRAEVIDLMQPYGILPADKGGSTGLPLHVASALAKATGGGACAMRLSVIPTSTAAHRQTRARSISRFGDLPHRGQQHRVCPPHACPCRHRREGFADSWRGCARGATEAGQHAR